MSPHVALDGCAGAVPRARVGRNVSEPLDAARTNTAGAPRAGKPAQPDAALRRHNAGGVAALHRLGGGHGSV